MAWGAIIGSLLSAGGQIAGGALGQAPTTSPRTSIYDPNLDLATQASQFDALNPLGFGNINNVPSPYEQLVGRIIAPEMPSKTRHTIMSALNNIKMDPSARSDPFGRNFTQAELKSWYRQGGAPSGRIGEYREGEAKGRVQWTSMPIEGVSALSRALKATGLNMSELKNVFAQEDEYRAQKKRLEAAGLGRLNEQTIISRVQAAANASQLIGDASKYSQTGEATGSVANVLDRDNRQMKNLQDRIGLLINFGGMSGAAGVKALTDADLDQNLRVLEQSLGISNAISSALAPGLAGASGAASASSTGRMNAARIAAQQAMAANQIRATAAQNNADSLGNAVGSATSSLGSSLANASYISQLNRQQPLQQQLYGGPGSSMNQARTAAANGNWLNYDPYGWGQGG